MKKSYWINTFLLIIILLISVAMISVTSGCAVCTVQQTRCNGNVAEICDSRGHWRTSRNCDDVEFENGNVPVCRTSIQNGETIHTCLPQENE